MTPTQQKAHEIFYAMYDKIPNYGQPDSERVESAKQCATIAVDEILTEIGLPLNEYDVERIQYWQQVKTEIENL